ncbi:hypothetical protein, partial [Pseudomonas sp. NPDC089734]|uniref:hypothetical protein n=1 Tax=Pseudomonas sp. NPDC089734 TaxID=3364469 RepID=UPI0037F5EA3B
MGRKGLWSANGFTLAWESSPAPHESGTGRTVHYLYEPGSFIPVAQALRQSPIQLLDLPDYSGPYD